MQTLAPAAPTREAAPALTLDERLALTGLAMDAQLASAGVEHDVRTAHIDIPEILVDPLPATSPVTAPATVEEVLAEAARLIGVHGRISRYVGRAETGYCAIGAIRAAAGGNRGLEDSAEDVLLARIRAEQPDVLSVGSWNDNQTGSGPIVRMLG